jgi:hypothetical protein
LENRKAQRIGILDTGATSGVALADNEEYFDDTGQKSNKIFMLPDKRRHKATKKMLLWQPLRELAREMNIVPGLHSTLIRVPKLADANYTTVFEKGKATIYDASTTTIMADQPPILAAPRCELTGLLELPLEPLQTTSSNTRSAATQPETVNVIFDLPSACQTLLWYHAAAGFPTKQTFSNAVRTGNYSTWPGLSAKMIHCHFPNSTKTIRGHLKGQQQGIHSTKQKALDKLVEMAATSLQLATLKAPIVKHSNIFVRIEDLFNTIHLDQTGSFPYTSQRSNRYIMVANHLNANYIFNEPMKNRTKEKMMAAYQRIVNRMRAADLGLKKHIPDNEASKAFKAKIKENEMEYEPIPPGNHRRNQAKRAIQTFKVHFISILAGIDDQFPLSLWCYLLEPAELTLNLLRQSNKAPKISAFAHIHGRHGYMKKPFAPLGCAIHSHVKPNGCRSWDARADAGFNLGMSMEHHCCYRVYITKTPATRVSNTVNFKHQYITNPTVSPESLVIAAAQQLTAALKGNIPGGNETIEGLTKVSKLFTRIAVAKQEVATAKAQWNKLQAHPAVRQTPLLPRVAVPAPRVVTTVPRMEVPKADCHITPNDCHIGGNIVASPRRRTSPQPNYISQVDDDTQPTTRYMTWATTRSIMQESMLSCIDLTQPTYVITPKQMSRCKLPMMWFCEMANSVLGNNGKLLEYWHVIANPTTCATWTYSYRNKIGRLAQGMPGRNMGANTIHFIPRDGVPRERSKDVTYNLITCLIRPEKN